MKTLIISLPRTGSTALLDLIGDPLNLIKFDEPFNPGKREITLNRYLNVLKKEENIVSKDILFYRPKSVPFSKYGEWLELYVKDFDNLIFLSRKNESEHIESYVNLMYQNKRYFGNIQPDTIPWHKPYRYEDIPKSEVESIKQDSQFHNFIKSREQIKDIAKKYGKELLWYEDIFYNEKWVDHLAKHVPELSGLNLEGYLDRTKRYRIKSEKSVI